MLSAAAVFSPLGVLDRACKLLLACLHAGIRGIGRLAFGASCFAGDPLLGIGLEALRFPRQFFLRGCDPLGGCKRSLLDFREAAIGAFEDSGLLLALYLELLVALSKLGLVPLLLSGARCVDFGAHAVLGLLAGAVELCGRSLLGLRAGTLLDLGSRRLGRLERQVLDLQASLLRRGSGPLGGNLVGLGVCLGPDPLGLLPHPVVERRLHVLELPPQVGGLRHDPLIGLLADPALSFCPRKLCLRGAVLGLLCLGQRFLDGGVHAAGIGGRLGGPQRCLLFGCLGACLCFLLCLDRRGELRLGGFALLVGAAQLG